MALRSRDTSLPTNGDTTETPGTADTTPAGFSRRTLVKSAAWSVPVIALAVGAPAQASSTPHGWTPCICGGKNGSGPYGQNDNGQYLVEEHLLIITYDRIPQNTIDVNVRFLDGTSKNFHYDFKNWPLTPGSNQLTINLAGYSTTGPAWVQVDGFNSHYSDPMCPAPSTNK
ncbi:hypothetical protein [Subtercola endophyticus]|uniref:hypothetical protein n=1 Tax=Subtercola endophyticus TaxID=2895559 RepID=UPI001E57C4BB|nr:hypothetical protein [Subtercola endophyticus]UFS57833.1 hypothetical protein LQ955_12375 [Subtercola endophyticus]